MEINASMVKELNKLTGAGLMDCKKALQKADGDKEKAVEILREKGLATAEKKAGRIAAEGLVASYIHGGGRIGVLIEVNSETDFVARTNEFKEFVHNMAMQVAAANPLYVKREDVPAEIIEKEKEIIKTQAINEGKSADIAEKMVEGRLEKYYKEYCLMEQPYIRDDTKSVKDLLHELIGKIGENIVIRRFTRYEMGEGLEKRENDLAKEIAEQLKK